MWDTTKKPGDSQSLLLEQDLDEWTLDFYFRVMSDLTPDEEFAAITNTASQRLGFGSLDASTLNCQLDFSTIESSSYSLKEWAHFAFISTIKYGPYSKCSFNAVSRNIDLQWFDSHISLELHKTETQVYIGQIRLNSKAIDASEMDIFMKA
jgi:hypothetical protein